MNCHCCSNKQFENCCQPIIEGRKPAHTAEELMRSRYSAYVMADINYLMNSHHPKTRPVKERKSILRWTKSVHWMKLEIINLKAGQADDMEGWVKFTAYFNDNGMMNTIKENSFFIKENGKWLYLSGELK